MIFRSRATTLPRLDNCLCFLPRSLLRRLNLSSSDLEATTSNWGSSGSGRNDEIIIKRVADEYLTIPTCVSPTLGRLLHELCGVEGATGSAGCVAVKARRYEKVALEVVGQSSGWHPDENSHDIIRVVLRLESSSLVYTLVLDFMYAYVEAHGPLESLLGAAADRVAVALQLGPAPSPAPPVAADTMPRLMICRLALTLIGLTYRVPDITAHSNLLKALLLEGDALPCSALAFADRKAPAGAFGGLVAYAIGSGEALAATAYAKGYRVTADERNPRNGFEHAVVRITRAVIDDPRVFVVQTAPSLVIATYSTIPCFGFNQKHRDPAEYIEETTMALADAEEDG